MSTLQGSEQLCGNTRGTVVQPGAQGVQTPCASATCPMAHTTPCTQSCGVEDALKDENPAGHNVQLSLCGALKVPMGQAVQAVAPATEYVPAAQVRWQAASAEASPLLTPAFPAWSHRQVVSISSITSWTQDQPMKETRDLSAEVECSNAVAESSQQTRSEYQQATATLAAVPARRIKTCVAYARGYKQPPHRIGCMHTVSRDLNACICSRSTVRTDIKPKKLRLTSTTS